MGTRHRDRDIPKLVKTNKLVSAIVAGKSRDEAAQIAGYKKNTVDILLTQPNIQAKIEAGLSDAAIAAGVSRAWVISKLKDVADRCMQARPVLNKLGQETGLFVFDASGANRSLELIGKHLKVFGDDASTTAQLGAAVIRLLAQEAQAGRVKPTSIDADIVPTRADQGPSQEGDISLAPGMASDPPSSDDIVIPPPSV